MARVTLNLSLLFILLVSFNSCGDCVQHGNGVILDHDTRQPIDQVTISKYKRFGDVYRHSYKFHSTRDGKFDVSYSSGGLFGCPDLHLYLVKDNYQIKEVINPNNDTILLEKKK